MNKSRKSDLERSFNVALRNLDFSSLTDALLPYLEAVDTGVSLGVYLRLKYSEVIEYLDIDIKPDWYTDSHSFKHDYQCVALLKKYVDLPSGIDVKKVAERKFIDAELACMHTNTSFITKKGLLWESPVLRGILHSASRKISRILGDVPLYDDIPCRFGPGNNVGLSNNKTNVIDKLSCDLTVTENLLSTAPDILATYPIWSNFHSNCGPNPETEDTIRYTVPVTVVEGSKLGFVPKSAKTDRAICTEPLMNSFVQLGIGQVIRNRLARNGCNLNSQKRNQWLAKKGSEDGSLATIDLSAASDTISYMLVLDLLPMPWFDLLDSCRSQAYTYEGNTYEFHKFSSMGNGYTFELESLIFLCLARATCEALQLPTRNVSVYGDDIIIPTDAALLLEFVLTLCGFTVNQEKSFTAGPFRESCGKDYYLGHNVRPVQLKRQLSPSVLITLCNEIRRRNWDLEDPAYNALASGTMSLLPRKFYVLRGPDGYGDGHLICKRSEVNFNHHHSRRRAQHDGFGFYTMATRTISSFSTAFAVFPAALYMAGKKADASEKGRYIITQRRRTRSYISRSYQPWSLH